MKRELTKREKEILQLCCYTRQEIATRLCISTGTVLKHLYHIRQKLGVKSKEQSLVIALKSKILGIQDIDIGFWDKSGVYIEDIQPVDLRRE